jgi:hypothetical protein
MEDSCRGESDPPRSHSPGLYSDGEPSIKQLIEYRYANLKTEQRKPGMEYVHPSEIRDALLIVVPGRLDLLTLSDQEIMDEYTKWCITCKKVGKSISEMSIPDMEDM